MKRLRIVTDSVCDLPAELAARYEITVVPVLVKLGDAVYRDGELTLEQLYDPGNPPPYTEAPSREELRRAYLTLAAQGAEILSIHVGGNLSETVATVRELQRELAGRADIELVDTETAALSEGLLVLRAAMLAASGARRDQVHSVLKELIPQTCTLFAVADLKNLVRGGRLGRTQAMVGSVMDLHPVFSISTGGEAKVVYKARGWDRALDFVRTTLMEHITYPRENYIGVMHARLPAVANELAETIRRELAPREVIVAEVGAGMDVHVGAGAIGITFLSEKGRI